DKVGKRHLLPLLLSHAPLDLVVILLGTNDLKKRYSAPPSDIAAGAGVLLDIVATSGAGKNGSAPPVLLLAPPPLAKLTAFGGMFQDGTDKSRDLGKLYREVAEAHRCAFLNTADVIRSSDLDGIHLEEKDHKALGLAVAKEAKKILR
ncbi:MAG TPA: GDSL-type esterase/lipase family protein, partial [Spirochaetia bacterium]|nr:GDSL-type esterase/lipase family protein [Spirochaetia bacterium]